MPRRPPRAAPIVGLVVVAILVGLAGCSGRPPRPTPTTGELTGLVRDQASGAPLAFAVVTARPRDRLRGASVKTVADGSYQLHALPPGRYDVIVRFAGQTVEVTGVAIGVGRVATVDVEVPLGEPPAALVVDAPPDPLRRYRPVGAAPGRGAIEATVTDVVSGERVAGAVVTATGPGLAEALLVMTDERGRAGLADLAPGRYVVSAYYTIAGRGLIEVRRANVVVTGGEAVVVPLVVELEGQ